ncbi:NERD domain-containing protein [Xenorhabdus bovienii]|uniref:AAA domain-containing protein n=2 Tax=Xenorhabdus bovienii TaxID=40576 RepID=UPI0023B2D1DA|nr:AAA domain-containing protein [Xenorhabdus bovienii]MDE9494109.1 NERD domain-containing protein [Xenorhabdus bovienii]MDE9502646.1 NERD domain-containing protein [Xenorhabdus bovienii]MDE9525343.1 NERD domain-containing protein [Xenorhabdus bovienii]
MMKSQTKMEVKYWQGGLTLHEVQAIEIIAQKFCDSKQKQENKPTKLSSLNDLKVLKQSDSMFPWKGYAGFRLIGSGKEGEFDLVIVTHYNIIIIELKHWNGELTASEDNWYQNGEYRERSAVSKTQDKAHLLTTKLANCGRAFPSFQGYMFDRPKVDFLVVLTGNADGSKLPPKDKKHVLTLKEFLKLSNENEYNKQFRPHPQANKSLNLDIPIFDQIFSEGETKPKSLIVDGYEAIEKIFPPENINSIYTEFLSKNKNNKDDFALLRRWNFSKLDDAGSKTRNERFKIVRHEKEVLSFIRLNDIELYHSCLHSLTNIDPSNITEEFYELFELPYNYSRLNEFISLFATKYSEEERATLVKIILNNFSTLHNIKIAHRDIGDHSIWISPGMKMTMSSFMSAYHQPAGTVGERRRFISNGIIPIPEEQNSSHKGTEFSRDIYSLGILSWLLMRGKRLNHASIQEAIKDIKSSNDWYTDVIKKATCIAPQDRYRNANEFLTAFTEKQPEVEKIELFDRSIIEQYKTEIKLYKTYIEDEEISSNDVKEIYRSGQLLVKIWNNALDNECSKNIFLCKAFIEKIEKIQDLSIDFIPTIHNKGISHKSEMYLIQDFIDAPLWDIWASSEILESKKLLAIETLISHVSFLHENELTHGDMHPNNILVYEKNDELNIFLIDLPDFKFGSEEIKNHRYSPEAIANATSIERDNYAVIRIACELFGIDWDNLDERTGNEQLIKIIKTEISDGSSFISLDRFSQSLKEIFNTSFESIKEINVQLSRQGFHDSISLLPDNGELFVFYESSKQISDSVKILLSGVNSSWEILFNPVKECIERVLIPRRNDGIQFWVRDKSQIILPVKINVQVSDHTDISELQACLLEHETFLIDSKTAIKENTLNKEIDEKLSKDINEKLKKLLSEVEQNDETSTISFKNEKIATRNIWKAILETETEALPCIEVADTPTLDIRKNELIIPYDSDNEVLDRFSKDDDVLVVKKVDDKEIVIGRVNIDQSTSSEIRIPLSMGKNYLNTGDILYFRTKRDRASYNRRKKAMERVLNKHSVISNLISYFEPSIDQKYIDYKVEPTEEQLDRYNQYDDAGNLIVSLNGAQRDAFKTLFSKGPLSLLQGPPGTGKTEFISAFVHYLLTEGSAQHILLVSQSHEAVNTAVERIRKHCIRLETPIDIVRFSNSEASVSQELKDVYSRNVIESRRQSFIAELRERIQFIQPSLKLEPEYIDAVLNAELSIKKKIKNALRLQADILDSSDAQLSASLSSSLDSLCNQIISELSDSYNIEVNKIDLANVGKKVDEHLNALYGIGPHEYRRVNALLDLISDYKDRLSSNPGSYEEFLARSRTLVCGTCVGMGLDHLGLNKIQYDWIIIDEAARSISSELAIAMQSANRILLVGDHKQLPPLFQEEHKNAIFRKLGVPRIEPFQSQVFKSDFEKAFLSPYGKTVGKSLLTQYRMAEPISRLVSDIFYDQPLITGDRDVPEFYNDGIDILKSSVTWLDTSECKSGYDDEDGTSLVNHEEINQILAVLKDIEGNIDYTAQLCSLISSGEPAIGIICMYGAQKRLLRRKFNETAWSPKFRALIKIDTVDSYQGKENRIIIVSITRNNKDRKPKFLKEPNRINVAMSRAMDRLLIVGSMQMWNRENATLPLGRVTSYIQKHQDNDYRIIPAKQIVKKGRR